MKESRLTNGVLLKLMTGVLERADDEVVSCCFVDTPIVLTGQQVGVDNQRVNALQQVPTAAALGEARTDT
jgi:hypothetical protein